MTTPPDHRPSTIERAYQLARGGECRNVEDIRRTLMAEGFEGVAAHLTGPTIRRALVALCRGATQAEG